MMKMGKTELLMQQKILMHSLKFGMVFLAASLKICADIINPYTWIVKHRQYYFIVCVGITEKRTIMQIKLLF